MAIINCPNCGGENPDNACNCKFCNYPVSKAAERTCRECGNIIYDNDFICRRCGCPVNTDTLPQQTYDTFSWNPPRNNNSTVKKAAVLAVFCGVVLFTAIGVLLLSSRKSNIEASEPVVTEESSDDTETSESEESDSAEKKEDRLPQTPESVDYRLNYSNAMSLMLEGVMSSEECYMEILSVWNNSMLEKHDDGTDKFTFDGSDFLDSDTALKNLFGDEEFSSEVKSIYENDSEVVSVMEAMEDYPEGMEEADRLLKEFYSTYKKFIRASVMPIDSYETFTEEHDKLSAKLFELHDEIAQELDISEYFEK